MLNRENSIRVKVFRYDPNYDKEPHYQTYVVPYEEGMSVMNALDYIYYNMDSTLAFYDHAGCYLGICYRCTAKVNGKPSLMCQNKVTEDILVEPLEKRKIIRDLVVEPKKR